MFRKRMREKVPHTIDRHALPGTAKIYTPSSYDIVHITNMSLVIDPSHQIGKRRKGQKKTEQYSSAFITMRRKEISEDGDEF